MSWTIDIPMKCDSFPRKKFENRAPTSCRPGPIISTSTISFELHASGGGDRSGNVQLWVIVGSSNASWPWHWPWIGSRSHRHTQYVQDYQRAQPCDCSVRQYRNMAVWISWNIDIGRSLNSRDSFPRRKAKNRAPTSCSPCPILWPSTISFELHTKTAEEIDPEKCTFRNFGSSVTLTLTLDRVDVTLVRTPSRGLPTHQIRWISEKRFVDVRTHLSSNLLGHRLVMT